MTSYTLRPNSDISNSLVNRQPATGTYYGKVIDNSDSTWLQHTSSGWSANFHGLDDLTLGNADEEIRGVRVRSRVQGFGIGTITTYMELIQAVGSYNPPKVDSRTSGGPINGPLEWTSPYWSTALDGTPWTVAKVNDIGVGYEEIGSTKNQLIELYVDVLTNRAPTATITSPADLSTVTDTNTPSVVFTYSDPEGDAMDRYQMRVFTDAQWSAISGDLELAKTADCEYDTGIVFATLATGGSLSVPIGEALTNGVTYHAVVYVSDAGSNGRFYAVTGIDTVEFDMAVDKPAVPALDPVLDDPWVWVGAAATDNMLSELQAAVDAALTGAWVARTNAVVSYDNTDSYHASGSMRVASSGSGDVEAWTQPDPTPVTEAMEIELGAYIKKPAASTARTCRLKLTYYDASDTPVGSPELSTGLTSSGTWTLETLASTVPANAVTARMSVYIVGTTGAGQYQIFDNLYIRPNGGTDWSRGGFVESQGLQIQRREDGGEWADLRWASADYPLDLTDPTQEGGLPDYEVTPGAEIEYRARTLATTPGGFAITSDWSDPVEVDGTPSRPDSARITGLPTGSDDFVHQIEICQVGPGLKVEVPLPAALVYALDRKNPIPRRGTRHGEVFDLVFYLPNDDDWADFEELLDDIAWLYVSPFGEEVDVRWITVIDVSYELVTTDDMRTNQRRVVTVKAAEVDAP